MTNSLIFLDLIWDVCKILHSIKDIKYCHHILPWGYWLLEINNLVNCELFPLKSVFNLLLVTHLESSAQHNSWRDFDYGRRLKFWSCNHYLQLSQHIFLYHCVFFFIHDSFMPRLVALDRDCERLLLTPSHTI